MFPFAQTETLNTGFESEPINEITTRLGLICQVSHILKFNSLLAYSPSISYYLINSHNRNEVGILQTNLNEQRHYVSFTNSIQYSINYKLTTSIGVSLDKLLKIDAKGEVMYIHNNNWPSHAPDGTTPTTDTESYENTVNTELGFYLSLPININYVIYGNEDYNISLYTDIKIPVYYSKNPVGDAVSTTLADGLHTDNFQSDKRNLLYNQNITIGLAISF